MAFRQALKLAACGLAGGSAAVLFSAVAVGKPRGAGGSDAESRWASPEAPTWAERVRPGPASGVWDSNWDKREPRSLVNLRKRSTETGEEEITSKLDNFKARATRHIFLIRHSQYNLDGSLDKDRTLTELGREQAELTGGRLASLGVKFDKIVHSSMTRAIETTDIISKHLPGVNRISTDLLREGAPIEPDPPVSDWKPEARGSEGVSLPDSSLTGCDSLMSALSSIMRMEPVSRLHFGTSSIVQMPNRKKTAMKSLCVTPMSSATLSAEHYNSLLRAGCGCPLIMAA
ncbi:serine/threonine-protein phosphatase PGAM5, mitochondrial isoform X3 [Petaurus breviceps papuanus]|uniref:serine/threonine-protein phosphatase PGAM5, mitochondrial isoform X3 n=1 Tax=Petaurus breviceps papuanus TaxID=3040969 RepID=UPI0036D79487